MPKLEHGSVRYIAEDWHCPDTLELVEIIKQSNILIGVDSGVLHLSRFTDTPAVGIWHGHYPSHYVLPRTNLVNLVPERHPDWNRRRRFAFNLIDLPDDIPAPWEIAKVVQRMLVPWFLPQPGPDAVLRHLLDKCRQTGDPYRDRHRTFTAFLGRLGPMPTIVETGCIRQEDDFSAGFSSYLFGYFLQQKGGRLHSVDIDSINVQFAKTWTTGMPVTVTESDASAFLRDFAGEIDGLYLDSADTGTEQYQEICLAEAQAAFPKLATFAPILIDDSPYVGGWTGKGALAIPWLISQGYKPTLSGYQILLERAK